MSLTVIPRTGSLLFSSNTQLSHTGDTNDFTLTSFTLPGNVMGANGALIVRALWSISVTSASNKTYNIKFGAFNAQASVLTSGFLYVERWIAIVNRNSTGSQICLPATGYAAGVGSNTGTVATGSVDTTAAVTVSFTAQLATAAQTIALESAQVYLIR